MTRPAADLQKHTLNLFRGDYERLTALGVSRNLPAAVAIRIIIHEYLDDVDRKARGDRKQPQISVTL